MGNSSVLLEDGFLVHVRGTAPGVSGRLERTNVAFSLIACEVTRAEPPQSPSTGCLLAESWSAFQQVGGWTSDPVAQQRQSGDQRLLDRSR